MTRQRYFCINLESKHLTPLGRFNNSLEAIEEADDQDLLLEPGSSVLSEYDLGGLVAAIEQEVAN